MSARFQVISLAKQYAGDQADGVKQEPADAAARPRRRFTWRFLAANNRSLAAASGSYPDAASCIASIHELKRGLKAAECEYIRDEKGLWTWVVRVDRAVVASTHRYPRQLRARMTCESFCELAIEPAATMNVQVVYR